MWRCLDGQYNTFGCFASSLSACSLGLIRVDFNLNLTPLVSQQNAVAVPTSSLQGTFPDCYTSVQVISWELGLQPTTVWPSLSLIASPWASDLIILYEKHGKKNMTVRTQWEWRELRKYHIPAERSERSWGKPSTTNRGSAPDRCWKSRRNHSFFMLKTLPILSVLVKTNSLL